MKIYRIVQALMTLIFLTCLFEVQGQYSTPVGGYSTGVETLGTSNTASQYSQYYQMISGPAPSNHIGAPQQVDITGNMPSVVLFSNQGQPVNYFQYASSSSYTGGNSLWVQGSTSWTQYAEVPVGAMVNLLAITPSGGSGYLYFTDSDGQMYTYNYYFYPYSRMTFYADNAGRHVFSFVVNNKVSNQVIIDVAGSYAPPTNYLPPAYYPGFRYGYYPGYEFGNYPGFLSSGVNMPAAGGTMVGGQATGGAAGGQTTGGETGGQAIGGEIGGRVTGGETGGQAIGGEIGGRVTGRETGGQAIGGEIGGRVTGGETGGQAIGGEIGGRVTGGETGGQATVGETGGKVTGENRKQGQK